MPHKVNDLTATLKSLKKMSSSAKKLEFDVVVNISEFTICFNSSLKSSDVPIKEFHHLTCDTYFYSDERCCLGLLVINGVNAARLL